MDHDLRPDFVQMVEQSIRVEHIDHDRFYSSLLQFRGPFLGSSGAEHTSSVLQKEGCEAPADGTGSAGKEDTCSVSHCPCSGGVVPFKSGGTSCIEAIPALRRSPHRLYQHTSAGHPLRHAVQTRHVLTAFSKWARIRGGSSGESQPDQPRRLQKGKRYRLVFDNQTDDAHPIHLHRNSFELTNVNGKPTAGILKDIVLVKGFWKVEVDVTPAMDGLTLFHCHQQLHMDYGFKLLFNVV